jgi:hypothetical protein
VENSLSLEMNLRCEMIQYIAKRIIRYNKLEQGKIL